MSASVMLNDMHPIDSWRPTLYLLGIVPALFFSLRFLIQWIESEKKKKSTVSKNFWYLSICGNVLCALHYFVQLQYLLMLLQVINGFIAWRNLNILGQNKKPFWLGVILLIALVALSTLLFFSQSLFLSTSIQIFQTPAGIEAHEIPLGWHIFGLLGCFLFASRFWVQWIETEKTGASQLSKHFWQISIVGSLSAMVYFVYIQDWVSTLNYSFGLIPYLRNLMLYLRPQKTL